jgi:hypothetical protein
MIELSSTGDTIVMLLVAGGVGLIGGLGAALIEWKTRAGSTPTSPSQTTTMAALAAPPSATAGGVGKGLLNVLACVVLGGIAAVAVLYFFAPVTEVVSVDESGKSVTTTSYDLIKLVALSLIVGSAGTVFLQSLQARMLNLANEQRADTAEATSGAAVTLTDAVPDSAAASLTATLPQVEATLQQAGLDPTKASEAASEVVDHASTAVANAIQPQVDAVRAVAVGWPAPVPAPPQPA